MDQPASADAPAGIHCANPNCRTRAGERSRGHQSCRAQLCGSCCQNEAKAAAEKGEQVRVLFSNSHFHSFRLGKKIFVLSRSPLASCKKICSDRYAKSMLEGPTRVIGLLARQISIKRTLFQSASIILQS